MQATGAHAAKPRRGSCRDELDRQVLPDGGHISRNPGALIELLLDLLPLRQAFAARNVPPPAALNNAIDRMMPMLRFFRHGDGNFALFNGMGPTRTELLATVLAYDDARGAPVANAPHSGYQRVQAGDAAADRRHRTAAAAADEHEAHAGCLSFELSARQQRIVVNCGLPATSRETWRQVARATAAHSTVTFNDTSSCRFLDLGVAAARCSAAPIVAGPTEVESTRQERDGGVDAAPLARRLRRAVRRRPPALAAALAPTAAASTARTCSRRRAATASAGARDGPVRGALPPASRRQGEPAHRRPRRHADAAEREVWTFNAYEERVELEESVYLAGPDGPRRTVQIVIHGHARDDAARALDLRASRRPARRARRAPDDRRARRAGTAA